MKPAAISDLRRVSNHRHLDVWTFISSTTSIPAIRCALTKLFGYTTGKLIEIRPGLVSGRFYARHL